MKYYVYIHYKKDTNEPFYVGKGINKRMNSKQNRNNHWHNIVNKHGFYSEIIFEFDTEKEALNREISLIASMKQSNIKLCNVTKGGEGTSGWVGLVGSNNPMANSETRLKASLSQLGNLNHAFKGSILATNIKTGLSFKMNGKLDITKNNFSNSCVYDCLNGKQKTHKGHTFIRK